MHLVRHPHALRDMKRGTRPTLMRIGVDTAIGMGFSIAIAVCIMLTTAATLHVSGHHRHHHVCGGGGGAAAARRAVHVLPLRGRHPRHGPAGSARAGGIGRLCRGRSDGAGAPASNSRHARREASTPSSPGSTLIGALIALSPLDPIRMLFWTAVINGIVAVPVMAMMMLLVSRPLGHGGGPRARPPQGGGLERDGRDGARRGSACLEAGRSASSGLHEPGRIARGHRNRDGHAARRDSLPNASR